MGGTPPSVCHENHLPLGVPRKPLSTRLKDDNSQPKTPEIIWITLAKIIRILKNEVRNKKVLVKEGIYPQ